MYKKIPLLLSLLIISSLNASPIVDIEDIRKSGEIGKFKNFEFALNSSRGNEDRDDFDIGIALVNNSSTVEHEATTSKIGEDQIFYCNQRGIGTEEAIALIVNGYCKDVLNKLPMEFAVEAQKLLEISLEGSVG